MKIKIISQGAGYTTSIINDETGESIDGVVSVKWECLSPDSLATVTLKIVGVKVDVVGEKITK